MPVTAPNNLLNDRLIFSRESAPKMRLRLGTIDLNFGVHQADFAALNPVFAGPDFVAGLSLAAEAATKVKDYETREAADQNTSHSAQDALVACRPRCQALFYAVKMTWPLTGPGGKATQQARLQAFGQDKYDVAREQPARMVALIEQAALAYATPGYAAALAPTGWLAVPQQKGLTDAAQLLRDAAAVHGRQGGANAEDATAYYLAQNRLYWFGQQLSEAAEIIYADQPELRDQFRLSPTGPERFAFTLKAGQRKAVHLSAVLAPTRELRFSVQAAPPDPLKPDARLWVDFLPGEEAPVEHRRFLEPTLKFKTQKILASALGEAGPWLAVENLTDQDAVVKGVVGE